MQLESIINGRKIMYNKEKVLNSHWDNVINLMDADIREKVNFELAPCSNEEFLKRYLELDPEFDNILNSEF